MVVNKLKQLAKDTGVSKFIKSVVLTGTTLLVLLQPGYSKNNEKVKAELKNTLKQYEAKTYEVQESDKNTNNTVSYEQAQKGLDGGNDALTFASSNVSKYYPDMKGHLDTMINSFRDQEHKDSTLTLLNIMVQNINDSTQKTGAIILALEFVFRGNTIFSDTYDSKITDETFKYIEQFNTQYKERFKKYYTKLMNKMEQLKQEIIRKQNELQNKQNELQNKQNELQNKQNELQNKQNELQNKQNELQNKQNELQKSKKEFEQIVNKFSPQDIKTIPGMKEWILNIQKMYKDNKFSISKHIQSLFDAAK